MTLCSYCGPRTGERAVNADHIVSSSDRRRERYQGWDDVTVPACYQPLQHFEEYPAAHAQELLSARGAASDR